MDLQMTHENICINEVVLSSNIEQGIEIDYMLPDYCKSIFKILKCYIEPKITSMRISGDKLNIDAIAVAKIIYVSEEDSSICSVEQKQPFSKTVDLSCECEDPEIISSIKTDYANCRVVNNKRLDLRGAVTISIQVVKQNCSRAVCAAEGMGIQLKRDSVTVGDSNCFATKQFSVAHSIDMPYGKPPFDKCIDYRATATPTDYKIVANKVIAKGEAMIHILYSPMSDEPCPMPEIMDVTIPISQIIDISGINEDYNCIVTFDVCSVDLSTSEDDGSVDAELIINAQCTAYKNKNIDIVSDVYSTKFEHETDCAPISSDCYLGNVSDMFVLKDNIEFNPEEISRIIEAMGELKNTVISCEDGAISISGTLEMAIIYIGTDNMPSILEKSIPFEQKIKSNICNSNTKAKLKLEVVACAYNVSGPDSLEFRGEIKVNGNLISSVNYNVVNDIIIDEERPKVNKNNSALTLYFADENERIWDIAKKYNTNVQAVMNENDLENDVISKKSMLLIPITE